MQYLKNDVISFADFQPVAIRTKRLTMDYNLFTFQNFKDS